MENIKTMQLYDALKEYDEFIESLLGIDGDARDIISIEYSAGNHIIISIFMRGELTKKEFDKLEEKGIVLFFFDRKLENHWHYHFEVK